MNITHSSGENLDEAAKLAKAAQVAIVVVGNHPTGDAGWAQVRKPSYGKEAVDRQSLTLEDEALIQRVYAANKNVVVVLLASFPYAINWTAEHVPAIVHLTHNSQELGNALADVLFGDVNPAGRLVQTWPRALEDLPPKMDYDLTHGRTYLYFKHEPLFAFGYGLSYTNFSYAHLQTARDTIPKGGKVSVTFDLGNTGPRGGDEVVQLYVRWVDSRVTRPERALKAFRRVWVDAGQTQKVTLELRAKDLAYWDKSVADFVVEPGQVELLIGRASHAIELRKMLRVGG